MVLIQVLLLFFLFFIHNCYLTFFKNFASNMKLFREDSSSAKSRYIYLIIRFLHFLIFS